MQEKIKYEKIAYKYQANQLIFTLIEIISSLELLIDEKVIKISTVNTVNII